MKFTWIATASMVASLAAAHAQEAPALKTQKDKLSYSIGVNIGNSLKQEGMEIDLAILSAGLKDAFSGAKLQLTEQQMAEVFTAFQQEHLQKQAEAAEKNKKAGEAFLAENKKKEGVKTTASGLQYQIITEGKGPKPTAGDTVKTNYRGTLIDGTEFDSSYKRGEPAVFPVTGVIPGWTEALKMMPVGSKWKLYIPADLAYGEHGQGPIPPNSTLIFEIELLGIEKDK